MPCAHMIKIDFDSNLQSLSNVATMCVYGNSKRNALVMSTHMYIHT